MWTRKKIKFKLIHLNYHTLTTKSTWMVGSFHDSGLWHGSKPKRPPSSCQTPYCLPKMELIHSTPLALSMWPCKTKLEEKRVKTHASSNEEKVPKKMLVLAQQNSFWPSFLQDQQFCKYFIQAPLSLFSLSLSLSCYKT